jgi:HlyD family secretion protein
LADKGSRLRIAALGCLVLACGVALFLHLRARAQEEAVPLVGVVRETEVHISSETNGRLASIKVAPGQTVHKGDLLAVLSNPELAADVVQSRAADLQARTNRANVYAGMREEERTISAENVRIADANVTLARQQYARAAALAARDFGSKQTLDEASNSLNKAEATLAQLQAVYTEAQAGPTTEERAIADTQLALAIATTADQQAMLDKTRIVAPIDSTVGLIVASEGEVISPGEPILTLEAPRARWFSFTIREDRLGGIAIGASVTAVTAAGRVPGRVTELRPLGEFATWRAARAVGDHDLNSFFVRVDPIVPIEGIEPGMTVWLEPAAPS